jgi:predicted transcriptional regulator
MTQKNNFYLTIISMLGEGTNLAKIKKTLNISKQNLNYYLKELKKRGYIYNKGDGWYELTDKGKKSTEYTNKLAPNMCRGHAYVWKIDLPKTITGWNKRIDILKKKKIRFELVGVSKNIPRIKVKGCKVWLCNNHIRIFDKKGKSYFGSTAREARDLALYKLMNIIGSLENKLGILFRPSDIHLKKEHYSLIKNDLAKELNNRSVRVRVRNESGEWLMVDDSMEDGGELETVGKNACETNLNLQDWFNSHERTNFKVTPEFILKVMNGIQQNQLGFDKNTLTHLGILGEIGGMLKKLGIAVDKLNETLDHKNNYF